MANISKQHISENHEKIQKLFEKFVLLNKITLNKKLNYEDLKKIILKEDHFVNNIEKFVLSSSIYYIMCIFLVFMVTFFGVLLRAPILDVLVDNTLGIRCVLPNNYLIWEATRPVTDCRMCENITKVLILPNLTREDFVDYSYVSKPIVVKNGAAHWAAMKKFDFYFFKELFEEIDGGYESVEEDCQFLTFKTDFLSLRDVLNMNKSRADNVGDEKPWYIGWSICHAEILRRMRQYYPRPHFLPEEAEHSHVDYIFMGYQHGAVMHLDYVSRLIWQAQILGTKRWKIVPPPECDHVCSEMSVTVEEGDIILLDTRQWYHDTTVEDGLFSLTVSSEYG